MKIISYVKVVEHKKCTSFDNPFFVHHRYVLQNVYDSGEVSKPYVNEFFDRKGLDCVAVIPYKIERQIVYVGILSAFRPPVYLRKDYSLYVEESVYKKIYECVAGSLEQEDKGLEGLVLRAKAELLEEAGFDVSVSNFKKLGGSFFPSHGQSTEKIHMFSVDVSSYDRGVAIGDGSVNEQLNDFIFFEINLLRDMCFKGEVEDPKVEIGITRLLYELR